jgi:hypothetical protein
LNLRVYGPSHSVPLVKEKIRLTAAANRMVQSVSARAVARRSAG